jgi:hypothetical protein
MNHRAGTARFSIGAVVGAALLALVGCGVGCGGSDGSGFGDAGTGADVSMTKTGGKDATVDHDAKDSGSTMLMTGGDSTSTCVPSTCTALNANCGAVTDTKCGGIVQCGTCTTPSICGGGGTPNQCGTGSGLDGGGGSGEACVKVTCASQSITCGAAGDGCGGMLSCGTCTAPQTCGGATPGQCGCTGTCAQVPTCESGTTTLTGKVYDPAATYGIYNALVYVPNNTSDPGLAPFPAGITCDVCGATAAGDPLVTTYTKPDGTFTLTGVPAGASVPLIIQLGRWRRQFTVNVATPCGTNAVPDKTLAMPSTHMQGDLPRIAVVTGTLDPVECVLHKMGIAQSEFTDPGGGGYINFFLATGEGPGSSIDSATPQQTALFAATGGPMNGPVINNYDMTIFECEGYEAQQPVAQENALAAYAGAGGRVFASDFQYTWFFESSPPAGWQPAFPGVASWSGAGVTHSGAAFSATGYIDQPPGNPVGAAFELWLDNAQVAGASMGAVSIVPAYKNVGSVTAPTQEWLHYTSGTTSAPIQFTFNTPIGATAANQCGRVTFNDWHAENEEFGTQGTTFPSECAAGPLTAQEAILEFMLFDLSACVQPYTPICTPETCAGQGIQCGPAGDGCGNALSCGPCPSGETCGGGGPGKCGTTATCPPETCAAQNIQCGPAGDGCGNELQCGNCPTGQICGLVTPGKCAMGPN